MVVCAATGWPAIRAEVAGLFGISADAVDPSVNLIGQGLDSIRMMALAGRWRRQGIAIDFAALAAAPTVGAWSALLSSSPRLHAADKQPTPEANTGTDKAFPLVTGPESTAWQSRAPKPEFPMRYTFDVVPVVQPTAAGPQLLTYSLWSDQLTIEAEATELAALWCDAVATLGEAL